MNRLRVSMDSRLITVSESRYVDIIVANQIVIRFLRKLVDGGQAVLVCDKLFRQEYTNSCSVRFTNLPLYYSTPLIRFFYWLKAERWRILGRVSSPNSVVHTYSNQRQLGTNLSKCWTTLHKMEPRALLIPTQQSTSSKSSKETEAKRSTGLMCGTVRANANEPSLN